MRMAALGDLIGRLLYPPQAVCIACGRMRVDVPRYGLCAECAGQLQLPEPPFCPRCGRPGWAIECPDCLTEPLYALDGRRSAYPYAQTAQRLVSALKYQSVAMAAEALADGMAAIAPAGMDMIVPVPLHSRRRRHRGYNQAEVLGRALACRMGLPVVDAVVRNRSTRTQTELSRTERAQNVSGAFSPLLDVAGRSILLVDDVLTTGATAEACAAALKEGGAKRVLLLTAARAVE